MQSTPLSFVHNISLLWMGCVIPIWRDGVMGCCSAGMIWPLRTLHRCLIRIICALKHMTTTKWHKREVWPLNLIHAILCPMCNYGLLLKKIFYFAWQYFTKYPHKIFGLFHSLLNFHITYACIHYIKPYQ